MTAIDYITAFACIALFVAWCAFCESKTDKKTCSHDELLAQKLALQHQNTVMDEEIRALRARAANAEGLLVLARAGRDNAQREREEARADYNTVKLEASRSLDREAQLRASNTALRAALEDVVSRFAGPVSGHNVSHPFAAFASGAELNQWRAALAKEPDHRGSWAPSKEGGR